MTVIYSPNFDSRWLCHFCSPTNCIIFGRPCQIRPSLIIVGQSNQRFLRWIPLWPRIIPNSYQYIYQLTKYMKKQTQTYFSSPFQGSFANAIQAPLVYTAIASSAAVSGNPSVTGSVSQINVISSPCQAPLSGFPVNLKFGKSPNHLYLQVGTPFCILAFARSLVEQLPLIAFKLSQ